MKSRIFISSVQREFAKERKALAEYVRRDAILGRFFDVFLFEEVPAQERKADGVYLAEVDTCDIYLGIFGHTYGNVDTREAGDTAEVPTKFELPYDAVKEAVVNAIVHRDYTSLASVQVMLFQDRLEVWSPGSLPRGMTIAKLSTTHKSVPVNPLLARAMYLKGYIEKSGTGTEDMIAKCNEWGLPSPEWTEDDAEDFRVILKWPVAKPTGVGTVAKTGVESSVESRGKSGTKKMSSVDKIMAYLSDNPAASAHELSIVTNLTVRAVEKNLRTLRESGRLRHIGPTKGGRWEVLS